MKVHMTTPDEDLPLQVQKWWKTESFGCKYAEELPRTIEDKQALEILESTTKKVDGRYQSGLLWKEVNATLPNNRVVTEKQLLALEKRLDKDKHLAERLCKETHTGRSSCPCQTAVVPSSPPSPQPKQTRQSTKSLQRHFPLQRCISERPSADRT
jgi:hypothetical protein